ncbi:hypothetical protein [Qipengyuania sp. JC766]|uniref:hypothetical protein n=1 Tax=Qipengyuania sp. JC766 TaxID=3232139 RepID=UPI003457FC3F
MPVALAACGGPAEEPEQQAAAAAPEPVLTSNAAPTAVPSGKTLAEGDWQTTEDGNGARAVFASHEGEPILTVACTRANRTLTVERAGQLQPGGQYSIMAGQPRERFMLPMRQTPSAQPAFASTVNPQQPILGAMAMQGSTFTFHGPGTQEIEIPGSSGIMRVVNACLYT